MSQQLQQPPTQQGQQSRTSQQSYQPGRQGSQQSMQQLGQQGQQRFEESVPSEVRLAVEDLEKITTISEWTKTRAAERGLHDVVRASNDIEDLAEVQKNLIVRQSPVAPVVGRCVTQALQQSVQDLQQYAQDLQQYAQDPAVQEQLSTVQGSLQNVQLATQRVQQLGQQGSMGQESRMGASTQFGGSQQFGQGTGQYQQY